MSDTYQASNVSPADIAAARAAVSGDPLAARGGSGDTLSGDFNQVIQQQRQGIQDYGKLMQDRQRAMAPLVAQAGQMARQPLPQPPAQQQLPAAPQRNSPEADESWLMVAGVLGAIAGAFTRQHVTNALGAMTGALEGYQQGSQQRFDQNVKIWSAEAKKIEETNRQATERYTQILNNRKMAFEQKMQELQLVSAEYKDMAAMQLVQNGQVEKLGDLIMRRDQLGAEMKKWDAQLRQQFATYEQRERLAKKQHETTLQAAEIRARGRGASVTPEGIDLAVEQALAGNPNATKGMRAGSEDFANFRNRLAAVAKERGMSAEDINRMQQLYAGDVSGERAVANRIKQLDLIIRNVNSLVPQALDASAAVSRTKYVPVNQAIQAWQRGSSDPRLTAFAVANMNLAEQWARALKPTGVLDVTLQQIALQRLSEAQDDRSYRTAVNAIVDAIHRERRSAQEERANAPMERPAVPGAFVPPPISGRAPPSPPSQDMPIPDPEGWKQLAPGIRYREVSP